MNIIQGGREKGKNGRADRVSFFNEKQYKNLIIRINTGLITLYQGQNHSIYY